MTYRNIAISLLLLLPTMTFAKKPFPEWVKGAVWYMVLPERFRNINPANDPVAQRVVGKSEKDWQVHPWASDWYKRQIWEENRSEPFSELLENRRYGGDLVGVVEKLLYLKDLGVDVIYLLPIFESPSIEKYDASTFHHVDNNFGLNREEDWAAIATEKDDPDEWSLTSGDELFSELLQQAHESNMRIVIEAVFNYCGRDFWAFKDLRENQAQSKYKDWFDVVSWDDPATPDTVEFAYKSWHNDRNLPLFKKDEHGFLPPAVKDYIFNSTRRWMDIDGDGLTLDGIDGWSVQHVGDLPAPVWREWNELVRSLNAEAVTISDLPGASSDAQGPYNFTLAKDNPLSQLMIDFFVTKRGQAPLSEFVRKLNDLKEKKSNDAYVSAISQLDDVTTPRIATVISNSRENLADGTNGHSITPFKPDSTDRRVQRLLTVFQLTYPGSPMIYYGDESGMWGGSYPDNIKPMLWKEFVYERESYATIRPGFRGESENTFDLQMFNTYRRLNQLRLKNAALRVGGCDEEIVDDERKLFAYVRRHKKNEVWVFMNLSNEPQSVDVTPGWKKNLKVVDPFQPKKFQLDKFDIKFTLGPLSSRVLVKKK